MYKENVLLEKSLMLNDCLEIKRMLIASLNTVKGRPD